MFEPYVVSGTQKITLSQWPKPLYTNEKHILIHTDSLLTVCDPTPELIELYLKKVDRVKEYEEAEKKAEEEAKKVLLQEEEHQAILEDDNYEPRYVEDGNEY